MSALPPARVIAVLAIAVSAAACAVRRGEAGPLPSGARSFGSYRATYRDATDRVSRFRLLLYAELPDRLRVEVLAPIGGARWIVDGGEGRLAVLFLDERVAYSGNADAQALERILGARLGLSALVEAIVSGSRGSGGPDFDREPAREPGLPRRFDLRSGAGRLRLERTSWKEVRGGGPIGRGSVPPAFELRPLSELPLRDGGSLLDAAAGRP